jgi:alanyl-tRNA synthetase
VRVVSIGDKLSVELCGGTHVSRTDSIWSLIITGQEAVSSGVKRITAVTGPRCADAFAKTKQTLTDIQSQIGVAATSQILPKLSKIQSELDDATSTIESLKTKLVGGVLQSLTLVPHQQFDGIIAIEEYPDLAWLQIKTIATQAREIRTNHTILIYDAAGTFALLATGDVSAKSLARELGLRGGGSDELVQGRDSDISIKIS